MGIPWDERDELLWNKMRQKKSPMDKLDRCSQLISLTKNGNLTIFTINKKVEAFIEKDTV